MIRAGQRSPAAVAEAARTLDGWLTAREKAWSGRTFERGTVVAVRKAVANAAANGDLSDYGAAEQTFLAVDSLSYALTKERVRVLSTPPGVDPRAYYDSLADNEADLSLAQVYGRALAQLSGRERQRRAWDGRSRR